MNVVGYAAAVALAVAFAIAGVSKLGRRAPTAVAFRELSLPAPDALAWVAPLVELLLAVLLIVVPWLGGAAALGLLVLFGLVLARALRSGATVGCGCFGSASTGSVSSRELLRNAFLALLATGALFAGSPFSVGS